LRAIHPYVWRLPQTDTQLLEIPVTTMPLARVPIHLSYLIYLAARSKPLAIAYLRTAMALCKARNVEPSFLLHPLDFLGRDAESRVSFFPGMNLETRTKLEIFDSVVEEMRRHFELVDLYSHAEALLSRGGLATKVAA
jgi:hypothetical protein